jgi:dienelactone hydrolase
MPNPAGHSSERCGVKIHYEIHGDGAPLILGQPLTASPYFGDPELALLKSYLDRLIDRYCVVVMDYPKIGPEIGRGEMVPADELTVDRYCDDLLSVADDAGFDRFAWWGYSMGGVMGLQLAARTNRVSALICGGWPPLGGQYQDMLKFFQSMKTYPNLPAPVDQYVTLFQSLVDSNNEDAIKRIACPKLAFCGAEDEKEYYGGTYKIAPTMRERRGELEQLGWQVIEIPDHDHAVVNHPELVVPIVRKFLGNK